MSLYGNIASTAPFQFDRIFGSRSEMDQIGTPEDKFVDDGVYAGRYVLVKYDTKLENAIPVAMLSNDDLDRVGKLVAGKEVVSDIFKLFQGTEAIKAGSTDPRLIPNQIYAAHFASSDEVREAKLNRYFFFEFTGEYEDQTSIAQFKFIQKGEENDENKSKYLYPIHYAQDRANYETIDQQASYQGYDGTIWMKTYVEDNSKYKEKYIYIGSLNASMPALRVTPEAPEDGFRLPHLNVTDSDTYDLHITTPYGFRVGNVVPELVQVKDLNGQLIPEINDKGETTGQYITRSNSDIKWQANEISDAADGKKAIYYNKAGFDVTKNSIDNKTTNELTCDLTGYSGQRYAVCDAAGNVNESNDIPDIYELQMRLPILGNVVAELWNLAYGTERNLNIAWEDGRDPERAGKRLLPVGETYSPQEANTIAGCINSLHDIMGMIIVEKDDDTLPTNLENYGLGYIYYFSKLKRFYRVEQAPYFNEANKLTVANGDFDFKKVDNVTSDTFVKNLYYSSTGTPLDSYSENNTYIKTLSDQGKEKTYAEIAWKEMLDPTANDIYEKINNNYYYVPSDLVAEGKTYYSFTAVKTLPKLYKPNTYYKKIETNGECYQLAAEENMQTGIKYYSRLNKNDYSIKESSWVTKNSPNNSRFYYNAEINTKILSELKNLLNKPDVSYGMQSSSVFFYKDQDKVYQPVKELKAGVVYYIGVNWQLKLDWDENNAQFVYLYSPTSFYPTTLIAYPANATEKIDENLSVNYSVYYNDPSSGWRSCNIDDYAKAVAKNIYSLSIEGIHTDYEYSAFFLDNREQLVDSNTLVADNVYIYDNEKNYFKATAEDIKQAGSFYTLTNENTIKYIYQPNKYYIKNNGQYVLDDRLTKSSVESTVWYIKKSIIIKDSAGYYPEYSIWNVDDNLIPSTVDLYIIDTKPALVELESFARQLNTAHGLILKINQTLDSSNVNTREDTTVKGIMNQMNDILNKFAAMQPGDFLIVDGYGRMHGAKSSGGNWIDVKVKPDPVSPTVTFEHADPGAEGIWATPTIQLSNTQQAVVMAAKIDNKGHLDSNNVTGVDPGNLLFTVHGITRSFADWITWAANQGGGTSAVVTDWIASDSSPLSFGINQGRLRNNDETDTEDIWTLSTSIDTNVKKALQIAEITSQTVTLAQTSDYNTLLPTNKQFKLTLGYHDNNKFSNNYTATTVNTKTFDIDMREGLAALNITQGANLDQHLFTPQVALDSKARCVEVKVYSNTTMVASAEIAPANYIVGTAINLDILFDGKLNANTSYTVAFKAISNNEAYKDSAVKEFIYVYKAGLPAPVLSVSDYLISPGDQEAAGQLLTWTTVTQEGVTDIKYILKKDGVAITADPVTTLEYVLSKGNVSSANELNGTYTVFAQGKHGEDILTSVASNAITISWFQQLATPVVSTTEAAVGVVINWPVVVHAKSYKIFKDTNSYPFSILAGNESSCDLLYNGSYRIMASAENSHQYFDSGFSDTITVTNGDNQISGVSSNLGADVQYQAVTGADLIDKVANILYEFGPANALANGMSIPSTPVSWEYIEQVTADDETIYGTWNGFVGGFKVPSTITTSEGESHTLTKILINGTEYSGAQGVPFTVQNVLEGKKIDYYSWNGTEFTAVWSDNNSTQINGLTIVLVYTNVHDWHEVSRQEVTCGQDGTITYQCTDGENATCNHSATNPGTKTVTTAYATGNHTWGDWEIVEQPTETTTGLKTRFCTVCAQTEEETIPVTGATHEYDTEWTRTADRHYHKCLKHPDDMNDVKDLGDHGENGDAYTFISWEAHRVTCKTCGYFMADAPHSWGDDNKCTWCHADRTQHAHDFYDWEIDQAATAEATGSKHRTCKVCGYTETAEIPKLDALKLETPVLTDLSTNDTCKFSFNIDPRFTNEPQLGHYYCTFYSEVNGNKTIIPQSTGWTYEYNNGVFIITIKSSYFTECKTNYEITAIAHDEQKTYNDSDESNSITFTTGHLGTLTFRYDTTQQVGQHTKMTTCSNCHKTDSETKNCTPQGEKIAEATCMHGEQYKCECGQIIETSEPDSTNHPEGSIQKTYSDIGAPAGQHFMIETCQDCGAEVTNVPEDHHWKNADGQCLECEASHTHSCSNWDSNTGTGTCDTCGYPMTCDHGGSTGWALNPDSYNDDYHYYYCATCGKEKSETHDLDAYGNCTICNYSDKSKCQHPNVAGNLTCTNNRDNATHTVTCKNCGKTWDKNHSPGEKIGVVNCVEGASTSSPGTRGYTQYKCAGNGCDEIIEVNDQCRDNDGDDYCDICKNKMPS